ncbi:hypothetical protein A1355_20040 [Methylomonas koyamae]|uniref:Uncharacterized protein n=1 Tax=Methylomonas koyamae TaxID=702114 RepID=A0A177P495_9GAMM|nr:hypothetical protein A1355_20040 [Methylomonas koyamae]
MKKQLIGVEMPGRLLGMLPYGVALAKNFVFRAYGKYFDSMQLRLRASGKLIGALGTNRD